MKNLTFKSYYPYQVPKEVHSQLSRLHLKDGMMWDAYSVRRNIGRKNCRVTVAFIDDKPVGWILGFEGRVVDKKVYTIHTYVQRKYRLNKIGTKLVKRNLKFKDPKRELEYYDDEDLAYDFYHSMDI